MQKCETPTRRIARAGAVMIPAWLAGGLRVDDRLDLLLEQMWCERLDDVVVHACLDRRDDVFFRAAGSYQQYGYRLAVGTSTELANALDAGHDWHVPVDDDEINRLVELRECFEAIAGLDEIDVADLLERGGDDSAHCGGIINDEEFHVLLLLMSGLSSSS